MTKTQVKHIPMRMCKICRKRMPKAELTRYVYNADHSDFLVDNKKIIAGRGLYICSDSVCQEKFCLQKKGRGKRGL